MSKRVLVVDDDPAQRRILEETIKRLGYETKTAQGGEQALQILEGADRGAIALVLLDLVMPGIDGMAVLERIAPSPACRRSSCRPRTARIDAAINAHARRRGRLRHQAGQPERLEVSIKSALKIEALPGEITRIKKKAEGTLTFADLVLRGEAMQRVIALGRRAAASHIPVLIEGESRRRQGADRARHPGRERARRRRSSPSTAAPSPRTWSRASCSATRRARSPAPSTSASASSRKPTAARCSSTRSASCRSTPRSSCCARCRKARSIRSAPRSRSRSTSA